MVTKTVKAAIALAVIVIFLMYPAVIAGSGLDWHWGSLPGRIVKREPVAEEYQFNSGEYFSVRYSINVKKWLWESEQEVLNRVKDHFYEVLKKFREERPDAKILYADFTYKGVKNLGIWSEYLYDVEIIGKIDKTGLSASQKKLIGPVAVAVIIGLIVAAIIATIILVQQPAVQKLLISTGEAIQKVASNTTLMLMLGFGGLMIAMTLFLLSIKRR